MAKRNLSLGLSFIFILFFFNGCASNLSTYEPKTSEEMAIKNLLLKWEETYNSQNVPGNLEVWNDKAQIMYGSDHKIATKKEYSQILPDRMKVVPKVNLGTPDIKILGEKAEVTAMLSGYKGPTKAIFYIIKENNVWTIMSWKY